MIDTVLISWSMTQVPWGRPRNQCGMDSTQAQGQFPGQAGPIGSLLDSPSVTSHLLFRGFLGTHHCKSHPWDQSQRLPILSSKSPPATPMLWSVDPWGGKTLLHRLQFFLYINSPTNSAER